MDFVSHRRSKEEAVMNEILCVTSSPRGDTSYSNLVAARVLREIRAVQPKTSVTIRDLARNPLPHIDDDFVTATRSIAGARTERQRALLDQSDILVDELVRADTLVIASAMINFSVPSTLKTWIDYVCRPGRTFDYTDFGSEGLLKGRKAILVLARGGVFSGPLNGRDHQETYLRTVLNYMGITDIETIVIEGVALGPHAAEKAVELALRRAGTVAGSLALA
jgi:FMN-dependent NADH-azoreductase